MKKLWLNFFLLSFLFFITSLIFIIKNQTFKNQKIAGAQIKSLATEVYVSIGEHRFTLFGYTSPYALVTFSGLGVFDQTYADKNGYFIFQNRFSPLSPKEACLTAQDQLGRLSPPLCLPPFPTNYNVEIGPVILPPTISVEKGEYLVGQNGVLSGQSIPNCEINLSFFTDSKKNFFDFIPSVEAYSLPKLTAKTDEKGNFSLNVPTNYPAKLRVFAQTLYENNFSQKSLTLNIKVLPWWMIIFKFFGFIFSFLKEKIIEFLLLIEGTILILFIFRRFFHSYHLYQTRAIILKEKYPLLGPIKKI